MTPNDDRGFEGLGRALRYLRLQQDKKQYRVATAAGITRGMLCAYEKGKQLPSLDSLGKLLDALGADLVKLQWALDVVNRRSPDALERAGTPRTDRTLSPIDLEETLGLKGSLAANEEEALRQMLDGFLRWVRILHQRASP